MNDKHIYLYLFLAVAFIVLKPAVWFCHDWRKRLFQERRRKEWAEWSAVHGDDMSSCMDFLESKCAHKKENSRGR